MKNNKKSNSIFIIFTGILISLSRLILERITDIKDNGYILVIMAVVNYVALGFVFLFLRNDFNKECMEKINSVALDTPLKKKCYFVISLLDWIFLIIYLVMGISYINYLKSSAYNDVISIIALSISIANNGLINDFANTYYKAILYIAKDSLKKRHSRK